MTKAQDEWLCFAYLEVFCSPPLCSVEWTHQNPPHSSPGALDKSWCPGPPMRAGTTLCSKSLEPGRPGAEEIQTLEAETTEESGLHMS